MVAQKPPVRATREDDGVMLLGPMRESLRIKGKLSYSESDQAWNLLRLKKEILHEFPYLKNKQGEFIYLMKLHRSHEELRKELDSLQKSSVVPIILFIGQEKQQ